MLKKILIGVGAILGVVVILFGVILAITFSGNRPIVDGAVLPGGAITVQDGYVSIFILPASAGEVALIDCGNDPDGKALLAALSKRGYAPSAVKAIFLSHGHPDHVAGCHLFAGAEVYAMSADVDLAEGRVAARGPLPRLMGIQKGKTTHVTHPLTDGETIHVGPLAVRAFAVPGHTAGSAAYLANGDLFLGDSATGRADGRLGAAPWIFSDDQQENRRSLGALHTRLTGEHIEVKTLATAHAGPIDGMLPLSAFQ